MTSELWNDLRGLEKVQAVLSQAQKTKKRHDPRAKLPKETPERHAQRLQFLDQRTFVRNMNGCRFLPDTAPEDFLPL